MTQIALWSINLRIMGGKSNVPLLKAQTIFSEVVKATGLTQSQVSLIVGLIIAALMIVFLYWLFGTEIGAALRATGNNEAMIRALGVDTRKTKMIALMLSNGLVAVSGALVCQSQKFGDINMGTGAIVIGLASIVIGEVLRKPSDIRSCRICGIFPDPCDRTPAWYGCKRYETPFCRDRCTCTLRSGCHQQMEDQKCL